MVIKLWQRDRMKEVWTDACQRVLLGLIEMQMPFGPATGSVFLLGRPAYLL
jgi:hypothetical protein